MSDLVTIDCPMPPSANRLWRSTRRADGTMRVYTDTRYATWKRVFENIIMAKVPRPKISGNFIAVITLDEKKRRSNTDADNRIKALLDALQHCGIVENDAKSDSITVRWGMAPEGCRVTLTPSLKTKLRVAA